MMLGLIVLVADHQTPDPVVSASSHDASSTIAELTSSDDASRTPHWRTTGQATGAAVTVSWAKSVSIGRIDVRAASDPALAIADAYLTFSDGSSLAVRSDGNGDLSTSFRERRVRWARFTVSAPRSPAAAAVGLSTLRFSDDDALQLESADAENDVANAVTASSSTPATPPGGLVDRTPAPEPADLGASWRSAEAGPQWVEIGWTRPREVAVVQIYGSPDADGRVASGRLEFGDGSVIKVGAVLAGGAAPTTVAFMPRVVTSLRFRTDSPDPVSLREIVVSDVGRKPEMPDPGTGTVITPQAGNTCAVPAEPTTATSGPRLVCPPPGSAVGERLRVVVTAAPSASIEATAWRADANLSGTGEVASLARTTTGPSGYGQIELDTQRLLHGPVTIRLDVAGSTEPLYVQVVNNSGVRQAPDASGQANGMTMAWADEFVGPLSISQSGRGTTYAATKPSYSGPSEFGGAVFADPGWNTDTLGTVNQDYLRIRATDLPGDRPDPLNWERKYLGGIISSAAIGGSGFSAQYGYFEARILGAPGKGTWPAFWALSGQSLVDPKMPTGELDVVELYGHDGRSSCHSIHSWIAGTDLPEIRCVYDNGIDDWALQWHTYGARMTPTGTTFYVDGREVASLSTPISAEEPFYFMVNLSMGGGWPTDLSRTGGTADMYVDYVRVFV